MRKANSSGETKFLLKRLSFEAAAKPGEKSMKRRTEKLILDDLAMVLEIANAKGLTGAADRLGVASSTIFRRLERMEAALEVILFERHRSGYVPTVVCEELLALAERIEADVSTVARQIVGQQASSQRLKGRLSVATNDTFLTELLNPLFMEFRTRYPGLQLHVRVGNPSLNLSRRDADIAIRATDNPPENLVGVKIARTVWALYGRTNARGVAKNGTVASVTAGDNWVVLNDDLAKHNSSRFVCANVSGDRIAYSINTVSGLADAIETGIGVGYLPCLVGDMRPGLVRLGPLAPALGNDLWVLTHPDLRRVGRVRVMLDFLVAEMIKLRSLLEGEQPRL